MHRCLRVAELVRYIVEQADALLQEARAEGNDYRGWTEHPVDERSLRRDPVLSLAFVCRTFHQEAICVLWRELNWGIRPLMSCFHDNNWDLINAGPTRHVR